MPKIYTKTGDQGQCSLGNGRRVFKCDPVVEALGDMDELNAVIGVANQMQNSKFNPESFRGQNSNSKLKISKILCQIQRDLFSIGAILSGAQRVKKDLLKARVKFLEKQIDKLSKDLPELKNFILPGGCQTASFLHLARAVCRRAERRVVSCNPVSLQGKLAGSNMPHRQSAEEADVKSISNIKNKQVVAYLNRLSDFLFVLARWVNYQTGTEEEIIKF
ncbi:MAG: cob(I)yrinic acid a,c-diamide adenosyltransferase [Candidatus Jacksonbacteria bacterium]